MGMGASMDRLHFVKENQIKSSSDWGGGMNMKSWEKKKKKPKPNGMPQPDPELLVTSGA